ncbi:hypothetical protein [Lysobacter auxotrophicus]|uniref:Uncharacterized protein n=1 Tax=Lysobacter auxotrophicus TaxID=2992573 RepID=A0ABN6UKV2_9GAMM|nr:hypothetical protein [Lysobacter auxotrophicus]BDU16922.1 hypothetical protein LA521A_21230 [Lysobacter auxotrophicus]
MKKLVSIALLLTLGFTANAGETGGRVNIVSLRPYVGKVYVQVSPGGLCGTDVFTIELANTGGKEMYAAALTALSAGKQVELEVSNATGCAGWGTNLQSLFVYQ